MSNNNNINIIFLLLFLICTACSNEELIVQNGEATFSIVLSTKQNVASKATEEESTVTEGNQIATADELRINDYVIAVFVNKDGSMERLDYKSGTAEGSGSSVTIEKLKATVDNPITIIAIANAGENAYNELGYKDLKEQIVEGSRENLIKVGINKDIKLEKNGETIQIDLTQLTARVDVKIETNTEGSDGTGWNFEMTNMYIYNINNKSELIIEDAGNTQWKSAEVLDLKKNTEGRYTFYTYEQQPNASDPIRIKVTGNMVYDNGGLTEVSIPKSYYMELNPKVSADGSIKSDGVLHGNHYDVTGVIKPESAFIIKWYIQEKEQIEINVPDFE